MNNNYTVSTKINKSAQEVFIAIISGDLLVKYFTDSTSGDLKEGERVIWRWAQWGDFPVTVKTVKANSLIELVFNSTEWKKTEPVGYDVAVTMKLEAVDENSTILSISESGWKIDEVDGRSGSYDNCGGWQHMAMCLKAFLEHAIDLRK